MERGQDAWSATRAPTWRATPSVVAKALGIPLSSVKRSTDVSGVTLVVGADWREGMTYKAPEQDDKTPKSADALNGADDKACMHVNPAFTW